MTDNHDDLVDYEDNEDTFQTELPGKPANKNDTKNGNDRVESKGSYVGVHATGFRDFCLKEELMKAINECGFEHPSEGILKV